jgi:hypothetical protein
MSTRKDQLVYEQPGKDHGIPSRMYAIHGVPHDPASLYAIAAEKGCCAWKGRTACGNPPTWMAIGGSWLTFATYRAAHSTEMVIAALCDEHAPTITRDMPEPLRQSQMREARKFHDLHGIAMDRTTVFVPMTKKDDGAQ